MSAPTGCSLLVESSAAVKVTPETTQAASPSGYQIDLSTPQDLEPYALATPDLRDVVVTLPAATVINPSAANGLTACPPAAFSLGSGAAVSCPPSSTVGSVQIDTPLLAAPLTGSLYLAEQTDNPFGSLIALYLLAEGGGAGEARGPCRIEPGFGAADGVLRGSSTTAVLCAAVELHGRPRRTALQPMLGGVGECSESQAAAGECGADSLLGQATVAIGAGPDPYWIEGGRVYLTGPYGGGPFGLAILVPAVAGRWTSASWSCVRRSTSPRPARR